MENTDFYKYLLSINKSDVLQDLKFNYSTVDEFNHNCSSVASNIELSIFHLNIRSLNKNSEELYNFLQLINHNFDVIVLSEIWACNVTLYQKLFTDYTFYYDLPIAGSVGGVGLYVKDSLIHDELTSFKIQSTPDCLLENIWIEISNQKQKYIVGGIYKHPGQSVSKFTDVLQETLVQLQKTKLPSLIVGDINVDLMKYNSHHITNRYIDTLLLHNFLPTIVLPTRITDNTATAIDHVYFYPGSKGELNNIQSGNFWCDITDHLPNYFLLLNKNTKQPQEFLPLVRLYSATNIQNFKERIQNTNWDEVYNTLDTNDAYLKFEHKITTCFNSSFPLVKLSRKRSKDKKWMTPGLIASSKTKNRLFRQWQRSHSLVNELKYKKYRRTFKQVAEAARVSYYEEQFSTHTNTMKQLWLNINKLFTFKKQRSQNPITRLVIDNSIVTDVKDICNGLNTYYCNLGDRLVQQLDKCGPYDFAQYLPPTQTNSMFCNPVDPGEIYKIIMNFKNNKSPGADNIGPKLLKVISSDILAPLNHIFNLSFITGIVPDSMKIAKVIPIYKKGDKSHPGNYRPISLLSVFDKILEKLMCKRLCNFLHQNKILYEFQFGFRKQHSTVLALMEVMDSIYSHLDNHDFILGIFLDLQKAFDTVNHEILLYKLDNYGIRGVVYQWFKSYLSQRRQFTSVAGVCSKIDYISTGVPQGSVLGPLLFLLYVNDIYNAVSEGKLKLFADDTNIFFYNKNLADLYNKANVSLSELSKWFTANRLSLNIDKTCYSVFGILKNDLQNLQLKINGKPISNVDDCKYLGILIDSKLTWQDHIDGVYKKIIKFTSIFYKIRQYVNAKVLKMLYFAFVYPHLLYGIEIYGNTYKSHITKLEILNNKILRILQNKSIRTPVIELYKSYDTLSLSQLHDYQILLFVHKLLHHADKLPPVFNSYIAQNRSIYQYNTRGTLNLYLNTPHSTFGKRLLKYKGSVLWNNLPEKLKFTENTTTFKKLLRKYITECVD